MTDLDRLGGAPAVHALVTEFMQRVFSDFVIGWLFEGRDQDRIVRHEIELAIAHLGGQGAYTGRPIGAVHRPLRINRGHFRRRLALLRNTLEAHDVDADVIERWVGHDAALEEIVTDGTECVP